MSKIDEKLDNIIDKQSEMNGTLIRQEANLKEHMRRTEILETRMDPVENHVDDVTAIWAFTWKLLLLIGVIAGISRSIG